MQTKLPQGYQLDEDGQCPTCKCLNQCAQLTCKQNEVCILADVDCPKDLNCSAQPRCVQNFCQNGPPYSSPNGVVEQCNGQCPVGYWCNRVGLPGAGGVCCAVVSDDSQDSSSSSVASAIAMISQQHPGTCPHTQVDLNKKDCGVVSSSSGVSSATCKLDGQCRPSEKCCFDGCDTVCMFMRSASQTDKKFLHLLYVQNYWKNRHVTNVPQAPLPSMLEDED
uniref:WAP domain-containing protein n=1 Tax=Ditylenchus dipsaci TaxID=166011 RepID=A0A915CUR1_9BILA